MIESLFIIWLIVLFSCGKNIVLILSGKSLIFGILIRLNIIDDFDDCDDDDNDCDADVIDNCDDADEEDDDNNDLIFGIKL